MTRPDSSANPAFTLDPDGVGWITFDDPDRSQNVLDESVMSTLRRRLEQARTSAADGRLSVLVFISGKPGRFIAGANIDDIAAITDPADGELKARLGQQLYQQIEELAVPTVAAIDGLCLGGGFELALACRFRVCSDAEATRMALPEVQLGLLPGWGGTTRLPRLVGLRAALEPLLSGASVRPSKARRIGLVSQVLPAAGFRQHVHAFAERTPALGSQASRPAHRWPSRLVDDSLIGRQLVLRVARRRVRAKTGGHYPAPLKIIEVLLRGLSRPVDEALAIEAEGFGELTATSVHANLLHLFRMRERARKTRLHFPGFEPESIARLGVLGAGVMGGGIAQLAAAEGIEARLKDIHDVAISGGLRHARELFSKAVKGRRMTRIAADRALERIAGGLTWSGFAQADLVVEAVVERMDVKRAVLRECEAQVSDRCIIATNTSSLSVDVMAGALRHPERFAGLHFFNPVHRMPLVEIVRGHKTSPQTLATLHAVTVALGKVPIVCADGVGFVVNRILGPYLNEAGFLLADGATVDEIDQVALTFGLPMGPLRLMDEVGLDIARHVGASLHEAFGERMVPAPPLLALAGSERLGRKNGSGFYRYEKGVDQGVDETVYAELGESVPTARGVEAGGPGPDAIRSRLVLVMINEAARVLDEEIVTEAGEVDLGMIMGTGFPPFRGGLLRFADTLHPRGLVERLRHLEVSVGPRFAPAPLIERLASENRTFYDAFPAVSRVS